MNEKKFVNLFGTRGGAEYFWVGLKSLYLCIIQLF